MKLIRTVIVDDERLARQRIRSLLKSESDFEVIGEYASPGEAAKLWPALQPDLIFLDVQMPRMNGFEMLKHLEMENTPLVVFVTAYNHYAVQAFDVRACDYLLKPFEEARFRSALTHVRNAVPLTALQPPEERPFHKDAVLIRSAGRAKLLKTADIDWIESADNYVRLHSGPESHLVRETLAAFETKLAKDKFTRIHRSLIVNTDRILEFHPWFNGDYVVVLKDGRKLRMSRTYRDRVQDLFGHSL